MQGFYCEPHNPIYFCILCFSGFVKEMGHSPAMRQYDGGNADAECCVCLRNLEMLSHSQAA